MPPRSRDFLAPDLFEPEAAPKMAVAVTENSGATPSVLLPNDLEASLATLNDRDFELLLVAVMKEAARRGDRVKAPDAPTNATVPVKLSPKSERKAPLGHDIPMTKANLVRAALKAGVKPAAIARQFGICHALIRGLLRSG